MIKDRSMKLIFIVSLIAAIAFPVFSIFYIYPSYTNLLINETEETALSTGKQLSRQLMKSNSNLNDELITTGFVLSAAAIMADHDVMKLKVFGAGGKTVYSTSEKDIGKQNTHDYFHHIVAQGRPYSKVAKKDATSAEGQTLTVDVVETYVPIMHDGSFIGAFEFYYDITEKSTALNRVMLMTSLIPMILMALFLITIVTIIIRAERSAEGNTSSAKSFRHRSPYMSLGLITITLCIAETIAMVMVHRIPGMSRGAEIGVDTLVVVMITAPTIYFFLVQPLRRYIEKLSTTETTLRESQKLIARKHKDLRNAFRQVETAKMEWENSMDCVGDIIIRTDSEGNITRMNKAFTRFTGQDYRDILNKSWEDYILNEDMEAATLLEGSSELYRKSTQRWYVFSSYPVYDEDEHYAGNIVSMRDNTDIKKMAIQLEEANKQLDDRQRTLKSALDEVSGLIQNVTRDSNLDVRFTNPHLKTCYEIKKCGKKDCICFGKKNTRCWQTAGTYCGSEVQGKFAQKYKNCAKCEVFKEATADPVYMIGEQFNNMMLVLEQKNSELSRAYEELKTTQSHMLQKEKMASIGQLAAGVAHEINNPMGFIASNIRTLRKYSDKLTSFISTLSDAAKTAPASDLTEQVGEQRKKLKVDYIVEDIEALVEESLEGADRVARIVQNLKSFSRVDEAEYKVADINDCIESTLNIVWNELKYKATVEKDYGAIPLTRCYPNQLNQVFVNLFVNAAHAIEKQGEIRIRTWNGDGSINISVSDTGQGIPEEKISRIFEPFFTTKPVGKGTGLGLSITYDIIKKHKGEVTVASEAGKGTTFTILIPVVNEEDTRDTGTEAAEEPLNTPAEVSHSAPA